MSNGHIVELSANDITVHQSSEEEDNEENRKTASLGDLSLPVAASRPTITGGTLERAQSLEMSENGQINSHPAAPPKKRKAPVVSDSDLSEKEPRLMVTDLDGMEQRGRLKSANEWGNLEDAISSKSSAENMSSDTESSGRMEDSMNALQLEESASSLVNDIMAALNSEQPEKRIEAEIKAEIKEFGVKMIDEVPKMKTMEQLLKEKLEEAKAALETDEEEEQESVPSKKGGYVETVTFTTTTKLNGTPEKPEPRISTISLKETFDLNQISPPDSPKMAELTPDMIKMDFERNHLSDEIKVSKFPFGSLERPKSDVLKKVIARKMVPLEDYTTTTTTTTTTTVITENPQPVSLTLIGGDNSVELNGQPLILAEESPVYSSDNKGVNSISISSMEVNIVPPVMKAQLGAGGITISTNSSQPSSIILIDDEKLDFTLRTPPSELETNVTVSAVPPQPAARNLSGQVFIVDSLSQPKVQIESKTVTVTKETQPLEDEATGEQLSDQDVLDALKTFVTEIDVSNNNNAVDAEKAAAKLALNTTMMFLEHEKQMSAPAPPPPAPRAEQTNHRQQSAEAPTSAIPRNTEIKFTTSTYESSSPKINGNERRHSAHVDQIRSTFEKNTNSEIPVPVRKSSIPTLKLSPSKIPVFNSNGGQSAAAASSGNSNQTSPPTQRFSLTSKSPSPTGIRSLSAHSIKTSARHPSGK